MTSEFRRYLLSYQIPTYRAKSGWVALGHGKRGVSLYTKGPSHIADFKTRHAVQHPE